jgi:hypothetical protein
LFGSFFWIVCSLKSSQGRVAFYVLSKFYLSDSFFPHNKVLEYIKKRVSDDENNKAKRRVNISMKAANDLRGKKTAGATKASSKSTLVDIKGKDEGSANNNLSQAGLFSAKDLPAVFTGAFAPRTVADVMLLIMDLYQVASQNPSYLDENIVPMHPSLLGTNSPVGRKNPRAKDAMKTQILAAAGSLSKKGGKLSIEEDSSVVLTTQRHGGTVTATVSSAANGKGKMVPTPPPSSNPPTTRSTEMPTRLQHPKSKFTRNNTLNPSSSISPISETTTTETATVTVTETVKGGVIIEEDNENEDVNEENEKPGKKLDTTSTAAAAAAAAAAAVIVIHTDTPRSSNIAVVTSSKSRKMSVMKLSTPSGTSVPTEDEQKRSGGSDTRPCRRSSVGQKTMLALKSNANVRNETKLDDLTKNEIDLKVYDEDSLLFPSVTSPFLPPLLSPPLQTISDNDDYDKEEQEAELSLMLSSVLVTTTHSSTSPPLVQAEFSQTLNYSESGSECSSLNVTTGTPFKLLKSTTASPSSLNFSSPLVFTSVSPGQRNSMLERKTVVPISPLLFPVQVQTNDDFLSPPESIVDGERLSNSPLGFPVPEDKMVEMFGTGFHLDDNETDKNNHKNNIKNKTRNSGTDEEEEDSYDDDDFET